MKESIFEKNENNKSESFKKNDKLNELLGELRNLLSPIQREKEKEFKANQWQVGFIVGSPRSGTTLLLQWIAASGIFSYPTNFLTRFAYAPYIGALVQKMIFDPDYDFYEEFKDIQSEVNYESNLGISKGALATNEFQHFFRNYMPNFDPEYLGNELLQKVDFEGIKKGLCSIESIFDKPFITKIVMLQYNLNAFLHYIDNYIIYYIKRKSIYNMQSLYLARKKYYSDLKIWWSVKPKEYEWLKDMDVYHQIAGQVYYTNKSIDEQLKPIPKEKKIIIQYEEFCNNPKKIYQEIVERYYKNGFIINRSYSGRKRFNNTNKIKIKKDEIKAFEKAYEYFKCK